MGNEFDDNPINYENGGDWKKYKIWVIDNIRRLRNDVDKLSEDINNVVMEKLNKLENKITALQVKSGVWGIIGGGIIIGIFLLAKYNLFGG